MNEKQSNCNQNWRTLSWGSLLPHPHHLPGIILTSSFLAHNLLLFCQWPLGARGSCWRESVDVYIRYSVYGYQRQQKNNTISVNVLSSACNTVKRYMCFLFGFGLSRNVSFSGRKRVRFLKLWNSRELNRCHHQTSVSEHPPAAFFPRLSTSFEVYCWQERHSVEDEKLNILPWS